jgi:hypothetical protein
MPLIPVLVECYEGSKAYERPRRILIDGSTHQVIRAAALSVEEDAASRVRRHRFEVLIEDGRRLVLIRQGDQWFLET